MFYIILIIVLIWYEPANAGVKLRETEREREKGVFPLFVFCKLLPLLMYCDWLVVSDEITV